MEQIVTKKPYLTVEEKLAIPELNIVYPHDLPLIPKKGEGVSIYNR
jgi:hypothetical protein